MYMIFNTTGSSSKGTPNICQNNNLNTGFASGNAVNAVKILRHEVFSDS